MSILERIAKRAVYSRLDQLEEGRLTLRYRGDVREFGSGSDPAADLTVHEPAFFAAIAFGGHVGAGESFVEGGWEVDDLTSLIRIFARNRDVLDGLETGLARFSQPARAALHAWNRNTRLGSRRNIVSHYDLGNAFFEQFLDETMTYSCGIFDNPHASLRDASIEKYDRICRKLALTPDDSVVEIGAGWGGFAIHAASTYGCRVTTTTISDEQYRLAANRLEESGLGDHVTLLQRDYRDLEGRFDKLVSIEMIEAVGHRYYGRYFQQCAKLLKPDGLAAIQAITIQDQYYESARREVDFIKRYIFPGGCIPSVSTLEAAAARTDLRLVHSEEFGPHYAETLRRWRSQFMTNWQAIRAQGFDDRFRRLWHFYLSYCEGGFEETLLGAKQLLFAKPQASSLLLERSGQPELAIP